MTIVDIVTQTEQYFEGIKYEDGRTCYFSRPHYSIDREIPGEVTIEYTAEMRIKEPGNRDSMMLGIFGRDVLRKTRGYAKSLGSEDYIVTTNPNSRNFAVTITGPEEEMIGELEAITKTMGLPTHSTYSR